MPVCTNIGQSGEAPDHGASDRRTRRSQPQR